MGIALVQAAIILAFESYVFATFQIDLHRDAKGHTQARTIPTFLTLYIFGFIYQLVLIWDALRLKNTIQVIGLVIYNIGLLIYGSVQMSQIKDAVNHLAQVGDGEAHIWSRTRPFLIAIPCIIAFGTCLLAVAAWKLYDEFAWTIYKHISADLQLKRRYLTFQVYIALLKFDFFFFLGFTVQFVVIVNKTNLEFALTIAAIPVTILILIAAAWFTRKELLWGEIAVIVSHVSVPSPRPTLTIVQILYFGGLAYFVFKMFRMYSHSHEYLYLAARKELTTFAVLTIILLLMTIVNACMCANNFDKGLKPYVTRRRPISPDGEKMDYTTEMVPGSSAQAGVAPPRRMID